MLYFLHHSDSVGIKLILSVLRTDSVIKSIFVPYDFTNFADLAFDKALEIAKNFDSKITLLTVVGSDIDTTGMNLTRAQEAHDEVEHKTKKDLEILKESKKMPGVEVSVEIVHTASNAGGILSFVENNDVDLIVMGSHGRSGFKKLVLGSVASEVSAKASCPVMIVKPPKNKQDR